jgi:hypothetical protein
MEEENKKHAEIRFWVERGHDTGDPQIGCMVSGCKECLPVALTFLLLHDERVKVLVKKAVREANRIRDEKEAADKTKTPIIELDPDAHAELHIANYKVGPTKTGHDVKQQAKWQGCPGCLSEALADLMLDNPEFFEIVMEGFMIYSSKKAQMN